MRQSDVRLCFLEGYQDARMIAFIGEINSTINHFGLFQRGANVPSCLLPAYFVFIHRDVNMRRPRGRLIGLGLGLGIGLGLVVGLRIGLGLGLVTDTAYVTMHEKNMPPAHVCRRSCIPTNRQGEV